MSGPISFRFGVLAIGICLCACSQAVQTQVRPPTVANPSQVTMIANQSIGACNNLGTASENWITSATAGIKSAKTDVYRLGGNAMVVVSIQDPPPSTGLKRMLLQQGSVTVVALWCPPGVLSPNSELETLQHELSLRLQLELPFTLQQLKISKAAYDAHIAKLAAVRLAKANEIALDQFLLNEADNAALFSYHLADAPVAYLKTVGAWPPGEMTRELRRQQGRLRAGLPIGE